MRDQERESLLTFPCSFEVKAMGLDQDGFVELVETIVKRHLDPDVGINSRLNSSRNRKYLSVSVEFMADSRKQLDAIYMDLTSEHNLGSGFESAILLVFNLAVSIGMLADVPSHLVGPILLWIVVYVTILLYWCVQSVKAGCFQWIPGISWSAATLSSTWRNTACLPRPIEPSR